MTSPFPLSGPLLDPAQRAELPLGISLDLARLPLALSARRRDVEPVAAEGGGQPAVLPAEYVRLAVSLMEDGIPRHVVIEGSPTLGLPYAGDLDVLLALFKLAQDDHQRVLQGHAPTIVDGEFLAPTLRQIANAMSVTSNGDRPKRIRAALERLGHVRIRTTTTLLRQTDEHAARIRAGDRSVGPVVPDGRVPRIGPPAVGRAPSGAGKPALVEEEVTWLLEYRWRADYSRTEDGEHWIARLRLNPAWLAHATSGWVAWVEMPIFVALGPLAKRLYMLLASRAACEGLVTWGFGVTELTHACAVGSGRPQGGVNRDLRLATADLQAAGVIGGLSEERVNGELRFTFSPGPVLALAAHLRGTGTFDPDDLRLQYAALQSFGVDAAQARRWLSERPTATRDAICYAIYTRETNPGLVKRSWAHLLDERIRNQRTNGGVVGFTEWAKRRLASSDVRTPWPMPYESAAAASSSPRGRSARRRGAPSTTSGADTPATPPAPPPNANASSVAPGVAAGTAEAEQLWAEVRARATVGASILVRSCLEAVHAVEIDGAELVATAQDGRGDYLVQGPFRAVLAQHLAEVSGGAVHAIRLVRGR